jgi:uncharacterized 2Fe-2S/4Fe-4S cluster protein (DUF4445 family)
MAATLNINGHSTPVTAGLSLFDHAENLGVHVPTSCHKQGKCKECMVEVTAGLELLSARTEAESHLKDQFRLSCQTFVAAEAGAVTCHTMRRGQMRIEQRGLNLPGFIVEPAPGYGLAMDLGTTTVVLRLFNRTTGELIAATSFENPQRFGGSEVMSRIQYDTDHRGRLLMRTLAGYLTHAIEEFPVDPKTIREMAVVGNSTMRDLFFRQNVYSIGQSPYRSITEIEMAEGKRSTTALTDTGQHCLLPIHPQANVYGAPIISGHVGADAAACMLAADLAHEDRLIAIMDLGTNTELIVGNRHRILAASCPAGPAFEGGAISCGMPALDGAIESVVLVGQASLPADLSHARKAAGKDACSTNNSFQIGVIGGGDPSGIAGSGLIDLLSELLRNGQMNDMGRFADDANRLTLDSVHDIYFTESDVNELAQAKGANAAGLQVVFHQFGVDFEDVDVFYLAGGFGQHLRVDAARRIGLIPDLPDSKFVAAGNMSIEGASQVLLSQTKRRELEEMVRRVEHCRLETHPDFFEFFVEGCQFKPLRSLYKVAA